jgi:hypothetical protein
MRRHGSIYEEPSAGPLHAGIYMRAVGQLATLSRWRALF